MWLCTHRPMGRSEDFPLCGSRRVSTGVRMTSPFACLAYCWSCHSSFRQLNLLVWFLGDQDFLFKNIQESSLPPSRWALLVRFIVQPFRPLLTKCLMFWVYVCILDYMIIGLWTWSENRLFRWKVCWQWFGDNSGDCMCLVWSSGTIKCDHWVILGGSSVPWLISVKTPRLAAT